MKVNKSTLRALVVLDLIDSDHFEHFKEILNLTKLDITPQEIVGGNKVVSAAESLTLIIQLLATRESSGLLSFLLRTYKFQNIKKQNSIQSEIDIRILKRSNFNGIDIFFT